MFQRDVAGGSHPTKSAGIAEIHHVGELADNGLGSVTGRGIDDDDLIGPRFLCEQIRETSAYEVRAIERDDDDGAGHECSGAPKISRSFS